MSSVKLRKEKDCLNCGHIVEEKFCPKCGQENIVVKEDALHMVAHAIADYFHFEHKFFGTLKPLLFKPGQLTAAYVAGKRVSFIHPIRLYIFVSIVFFLFVFSGRNKENTKEKEISKTEKTSNLNKTQQDSLVDEQLKSVEENLKYIPGGKDLKDSILKEAKAEILKDATSDKPLKPSKVRKIKYGRGSWSTLDTTVADYEKNQLALAKDKRDGFIKHYFIKKTIEVNKQEDPGKKFLEDILHNIPKMMFLLLPLFALFLKLVYINKNKYYYEHLIYSFHIHSAIFLSILFTMLLQWLIGFVYDVSDWLSLLCMVYIIWYIYRSLRTFYGSSRWVTILKIFFLNFCYTIALTICFLIIMAVSFVSI